MKDTTVNPIHIALDKNFDSEFCGSLPLHLVNLIQPHGLLLVLDKMEFRIIQVSQNVGPYFSVAPEALLELPLSAFIPAEQFADIQAKFSDNPGQEKIPFSLTFSIGGKEVSFTALVHPKEAYILIELEENTIPAKEHSFIRLYQQIKYSTSLLKQAAGLEAVASLMAREIKDLTQFDRVLVYQFDPQWNGIVIAQAKEADMEDFLHLRFPASDVPKQARDLYYRNPYRLIPTRSYEPVGMVPVVNPLSQRFTDLSDCNLRSVARVHLEYLGNMHVMASMSLPIIIDERLWGLISCHHKTPKNPNYELRSALELLTGIFSAQMAAREKEAAMHLRVQLQAVFSRLLEQLYHQESLSEGLLSGDTTLLDLFQLSGAALLFEGSVWTSGQTPGHQEMKELAYWLRRQQADKVFTTNALSSLYARGRDYKESGSGLMAIAINPEQGEYLLGFRPEVLQTIEWGGNPHQAIQMEADGKTYHPRNSFATYQETVRYTARPWMPEELETAAALRSTLLEKIVKDNY
jgi:light-regulated signal transduction histidine kinase (bacteriophytochrome)